MRNMFDGCTNIKNIRTGWNNGGKVYEMQDMFSNCSSLEKLIFDTEGTFKTRPSGNNGTSGGYHRIHNPQETEKLAHKPSGKA